MGVDSDNGGSLTDASAPFNEQQLSPLVRAAQAGDEEALREVIARAMEYLFPAVLSMLYERRARGEYVTETLHAGGSDVAERLRDDAWEITHLACCRIADRIDTFRGHNAWGRKVQFGTWAYAIARNELRTLLRDRRRERRRYGHSRDDSPGASGGYMEASDRTAVPLTRSPERAAVEQFQSAFIREALQKAPLTPEQREAVVLFHGYGYRQEQIARLTGVQVGTVKKRVFDALRKLRTYVAETPSPGGAGAFRRTAESSKGGIVDE